MQIRDHEKDGSLGSCARILVLRNNDLGDILVVTPLFAALKQYFPEAAIVAAVSPWATECLKGNTDVDGIFACSAPWHNSKCANASKLSKLCYILLSQECRKIVAQRLTHGVDVLGSKWGALLMARCGIPQRYGVKGYAGGHLLNTANISYNPSIHVGRQALNFLSLLCGKSGKEFEVRPKIVLEKSERNAGDLLWVGDKKPRVVIGPGGGYESKRWTDDHWDKVVHGLGEAVHIGIVGDRGDQRVGELLAARYSSVADWTGLLSLRESFAVVAAADMVICNSTMLMHVAAAFRKPCLVLLGPIYNSAQEHHAQWGYPETVVYGKENGRGQLAQAPDVVEWVRKQTGN